jgi:hypothetical protein
VADITLPGAGESIAVDQVGGVSFPVSKIVTGAAGVDGGPVTADNPLPVTLPAIYERDSAAASDSPGVFILAVRQDSDTQTAADGDFASFKLDEEGRLKVSTKPASYPDITGDITAVQASISVPVAGGTVEGDVSRASNVMAFCTGTFGTINCTFEGSLESSGDANWFTVQAVRSNANTIETTTGNLSAQPAYAWELSVNALRRLRVRCTARTSGTQSWRFVQGTYATEPIPAAQISGTQPVSGTVTASGVVGPAAHDAAVSGNPVRIAGRALTANYTPVATGDTADAVATLVGARIVKPYSIPEAEFVGIDDITASTTAKQIKNATASNQNYVTGLNLGSDALGAAGDIQLRSTPVASTTATIASNTLVMAATYNWKVGDMVYVTASTVTGLSAGSYYYLLTVSGASLTFSATRGGSTLAISGTTVSATLAKILFRHRLQTASLPLVPLDFADPVGGGTNLAIEMCTPVSLTSGRVDYNVRGYVAP